MRKTLSLIIREIKLNKYIIIKYINLEIYVSKYYNDQFIKILLKYITFIINNLKINILIKINIFNFKKINLIIFTRINYINNYNIIFEFIIILLAKLFIK